MGTLEGRIAVVTGGAAGVGRGIASELAHGGARVFVTGRSIQDASAMTRGSLKFVVTIERMTKSRLHSRAWIRMLAQSTFSLTTFGVAMSG